MASSIGVYAAVAVFVLCLLLAGGRPCRAETGASATPGALTAEVNGATLAYRVQGEGEPLVCVMGFASTMDMWPPALLDALAANRKVIVFDNRGMGLSTATDEPLSLDLMAKDVLGLMDALGEDRFSVLGFSMGADLSLSLLRLAPERVTKVVLYAGSPGSDQDVMPTPETMAQLEDPSGTPEERGMRMLRLMFPAEFMTAHPNPGEYFPEVREIMDPAMIGRQAQAISERPDQTDLLPTIACPVMLLAGMQDRIVPPQNSRLMAQRIPGAVLVEFQDAGHGLMYQHPDKVSALVEAFLAWE